MTQQIPNEINTKTKMNDPALSCFPPDMLIDKIDLEEFSCLLCYGIMRNPVIDLCKHKYNRECLAKWIKENNTCPMSRNELDMEQTTPSQSAIELYPTTRTKCAHFETCDWLGTFESINRHLADDCLYESVKYNCVNIKCRAKSLPRIEIANHLSHCGGRPVRCTGCKQKFAFKGADLHLYKCLCVMISCPWNCGVFIRIADDDEHGYHCAAIEFKCPFSNFGCQQSIIRNELLHHCFQSENSQTHLLQTLDSFIEAAESLTNNFDYVSKGAQKLSDILEDHLHVLGISTVSVKSVKLNADFLPEKLPLVTPDSTLLGKTNNSKPISFQIIGELIWKPNDCTFTPEVSRKLIESVWRAVTTIQERKAVEAGRRPEIFPNPLDEQKLPDVETTTFARLELVDCQPMIEKAKAVAFSTNDSRGLFEIVEGTLITRISNRVFKKGGLVLQTKPIFPFQVYRYSVEKCSNPSRVGFGICSHETVKKHGYTIADNDNHGCYIAFINKEMIANGSKKRFKTQSSTSIFHRKSISSFYWDSNEGKLHFMDDDLFRIQSLDIPKEFDLADFYPCVFMSTEACVSRKWKFNDFSSSAYHDFSSFFRASHIFALSNEVIYCKHTVGKLDWPIVSGKPYRFFIEQKTSNSMAFSLHFDLFDYPFDINNPKKYSWGMVKANGQEYRLYPLDNDDRTNDGMEFATGDTVELVYDYNDNRFVFRNLTTNKVIQRRLEEFISEERRLLYIGVMLDKEGDSVRYISNEVN
jgi:hypothetical protein